MPDENPTVIYVGQTPVLPIEKKFDAANSIWVDSLSILGTGDASNPFRVNEELFVKYEELAMFVKELPILTDITFGVSFFDAPLQPGQSVFCKIESAYLFEITQILSKTTDTNDVITGMVLTDLVGTGGTFNPSLWLRVYSAYDYLKLDSARAHTTATSGRQEGLIAEVFGGFKNGNPINCMSNEHGYFISPGDYPISAVETGQWYDYRSFALGLTDEELIWKPKLSYYTSAMGLSSPSYNPLHGLRYSYGPNSMGGTPTPRAMFIHIKNVGSTPMKIIEVSIEMLIKDHKPGMSVDSQPT